MASEILSYTLTAGVTNSESVLINGVDLYRDENGGGTDYELLSDQALGANQTFVFNDKFVITDTDHLCAATASSANVDIVVSFLDQTR